MSYSSLFSSLQISNLTKSLFSSVHLANLTKSFITSGKNKTHVGRWGLNKGNKAELVIKYANEDHCGCCGSLLSNYPSDKPTIRNNQMLPMIRSNQMLPMIRSNQMLPMIRSNQMLPMIRNII